MTVGNGASRPRSPDMPGMHGTQPESVEAPQLSALIYAPRWRMVRFVFTILAGALAAASITLIIIVAAKDPAAVSARFHAAGQAIAEVFSSA